MDMVIFAEVKSGSKVEYGLKEVNGHCDPAQQEYRTSP
jgi:hypothetical protein